MDAEFNLLFEKDLVFCFSIKWNTDGSSIFNGEYYTTY